MRYITILIGIVLLGMIGFGVYKFVDFQKQLYKQVTLQNTKIFGLSDFLIKNFPAEVEKYNIEKKIK